VLSESEASSSDGGGGGDAAFLRRLRFELDGRPRDSLDALGERGGIGDGVGDR